MSHIIITASSITYDKLLLMFMYEVITMTVSSDSKLNKSLLLDYRWICVPQFKSAWNMSQHAPDCHFLCNLDIQVRTVYKPIINSETYFRLKIERSKQASTQESEEHAVWATEVSMNTYTHILLVKYCGRKQILTQLVWVRAGKHKVLKPDDARNVEVVKFPSGFLQCQVLNPLSTHKHNILPVYSVTEILVLFCISFSSREEWKLEH